MRTRVPEIVATMAGMALFAVSMVAEAQDNAPFECDNNFGECGTPQLSGGGCGCGGGGSILVMNTDLGDTYQYADDYDDDGIEDPFDNCPFTANRDQADDDGDGIGTACDNCPLTPNEDQMDIDGDGMGDACDDDMDGDGVPNDEDVCPRNPDPLQSDADGDGVGNACDEDMDGDGILNLEDNCPLVYNPDQEDDDPGRFGDACDADEDGDGVREAGPGVVGPGWDNCPGVANPLQEDTDGDGIGDLCDPDIDNDGITNVKDNCVYVPNPDQADDDRDGLGNACDPVFCYVVNNDIDGCLDPDDSFTVYSPNKKAETGDDVRLRLFANRVDEPIRYRWTIIEAPPRSHARIENPVGAVSVSSPYEYHYLKDETVILVPDQPGTYKVAVTAELVWEDEVTGEPNVKTQAMALIEVEGEPVGNGCSVSAVGAGSGSGVISLLLVLLGLTVRRFGR